MKITKPYSNDKFRTFITFSLFHFFTFSELSSLFDVIKKVRVEVPGGLVKFIRLQGNGIYIFQKSVKSFEITIWRPIDR